MTFSRLPEDDVEEAERIAALRRLGMYEAPRDAELDRLAHMIGELFEIPCVMINAVDRERTWCLARSSDIGPPPRREESFSALTVDHDMALFIEDAHASDDFREHPLVTGAPFLRAFAGERLVSLNGHVLGTLCLFDTQPHVFDSLSRQRLADLARLISLRLNQRQIDEQRAADDAVVERHTRLLDHLPEGIVLLNDRRHVHYANAAAQRLLNGKGPSVVGTDFNRLVTHPEGHYFATASYTQLPLEVHALPPFQGFETLQLGDRSTLVSTHRALQRLRSLVDSWPDGILVCDFGRLHIYEWNTAARQLIDAQEDAIEGSRLSQWFVSSDRRVLQRRIRQELAAQGDTLRQNLTLHNDTPVEITLVPMRDLDDTSLIVVLRDRRPYLDHLRTVKRQLAKAEEMISQDALTGLLNRFGFEQAIEEFMAEARSGTPFALMIADIDHFKDINDTHGHQLGDEALKVVASRLAEQLRDNDAVARYGGEEFCILMAVPDTRVVKIAERMRQAVAATPIILDDGHQLRLTISIGATYYQPELSADAMFERADEALYEAKEYGRNRTVMLQPLSGNSMDEEE
ncbi:PAS domain S-box-containing protein/diguanylate cyclase (GGDEF)-like protein [Chromohalobacter marismortui]|uniref:diguanylate cyclase n=1 Tax=Chromohalobacter marismortui TaxID=42055 RepID=A0A4R7NPV4_9GAMM|nr:MULTISPECIES: diguanylate cyclase [Chromohalobacter]MCI0508803.1 diguanylate cyclase [Chromohalobacter sp.]MCI0594340.1 diguanylate cyclase [Chromohalobacter sp.]TDU22827.1 PAS domain S-box-containing protein/diguanylate cyclase (GGDEF)-like protein [Chromohalobacter marismortui]